MVKPDVRDGGTECPMATSLAGRKDRVEAIGGRIMLDSPQRGGDQPARGAPAHPATAA